MEIITLKRGMGKTTRLIKESAKTGIPILVASSMQACDLVEKAEEINLNMPNPLFIGNSKIYQYSKRNSNTMSVCINGMNIEKVYVDELDMVLEKLIGCRVEKATRSEIQEKPTNIDKLKNNIDNLVNKYSMLINKGEYNSAINVIKNIDMINKIIVDMDKNKTN